MLNLIMSENASETNRRRRQTADGKWQRRGELLTRHEDKLRRMFASRVGTTLSRILGGDRSRWRLLATSGNRLWFAAVLMTAVIGLSWLAADRYRAAPEPETDSASSEGLVERIEVSRLWLPEGLTRLAIRQNRSPFLRNHEDLQDLLELENLEDLCYALTITGHLVSGKSTECTYIRYPYDQPGFFGEFMDVLATAAANPPPFSAVFRWDWSPAVVQVVPEQPWNRAPRTFILEQQGGAAPARDRADPR